MEDRGWRRKTSRKTATVAEMSVDDGDVAVLFSL
jgi:hypothetical protein